jgi:hypothetical protein
MTRRNKSSRARAAISLVALILASATGIATGPAGADSKYRPLENRPWGDLRTKPPTPPPTVPPWQPEPKFRPPGQPAPTVPPGMRGGVAATGPSWGQSGNDSKVRSKRSDGLVLTHMIDRYTKNPPTASGCDNRGRTGGCWQTWIIPDGRGGEKKVEIAFKYKGGPPFDGQENLLMNELKKSYTIWNAANVPTVNPDPKHR